MNKDSKDFEKSLRKLSGKTLNSVGKTILEVKNASCLDEITDSKKLVGYDNVYRIRIGSLRVFFKYLVPRGEAYDKKYEEKLRKDDK